MKRRRLIIKLCVFMLAGAIINVGVAWCCTTPLRQIKDIDENGEYYKNRECRNFLILHSLGMTYAECRVIHMGESVPSPGTPNSKDGLPTWLRLEWVPSWPWKELNDGGSHFFFQAAAFGLPMRS